MITTETARVWRYGKRRYLTKRSALMAEARDIFRVASAPEHEDVSNDDAELGHYCRCDYCSPHKQYMLRMIFDALRPTPSQPGA